MSKEPGWLTITRGLPASGKTTYARQLVDSRPAGEVVRLNRDEIRAMMLPSSYRRPEGRPEQLVSNIQHGQITELLRAGVDVIVDDTNLRIRTVRTLVRLAERAGARWQCADQFLEVPVAECVRRDAGRENPVGEEVIQGMWRKYLSDGRTLEVPALHGPVTGRLYEPPIDSIPAVMVDLDGTIALHYGVRDPYDASRCHLDKPNTPVIEAVFIEWRAGNRLLFCSSRSEEFREVTANWIRAHVFADVPVPFQLFMRPAGDKRDDATVKLELFDKHIRDHYDVRRVYDDRDRVVAAWRSIGLTVLQVAPGRF